MGPVVNDCLGASIVELSVLVALWPFGGRAGDGRAKGSFSQRHR